MVFCYFVFCNANNVQEECPLLNQNVQNCSPRTKIGSTSDWQMCAKLCANENYSGRCVYWIWHKKDTSWEDDCVICESEGHLVDDPNAIAGHQSCQGEISDPCCPDFELESGGMADFYQGERLGRYVRVSAAAADDDGGGGGRAVYRQTAGSNYLYWLSAQNLWMVGPTVGEDFGGILNRSPGICPEDLTSEWEYWSDWQASWESDWSLSASCNGASVGSSTATPTYPPSADVCTWGDACRGCAITHTHNGVTYCCATDCDSGWLNVQTENGQVVCACGHSP